MKWSRLSRAILFFTSLATTAQLGVSAWPVLYIESEPDPILQAENLRKEGRLVEAAEVLESALKTAERSGRQDVRLAVILNNLANLSGILGRYSRSETLYKRCIRLWRTLGMTQMPHRLRSAGGLIALYMNTSEFRKAEAVYTREIKTLDATAGLPEQEQARILQQAGLIAHIAGKLDIAEERYLQAAILFEKSGTPASADLVSALNLLAVVHFRTGRSESSLELLARARDIVEQNLGKASPQLIYILVNHGSFVRDDAQAEESFREALRIAESSLGRGHPDAALVLESYAKHLRKTGRKAEARSMEARAKSIVESHPEAIRRRHTVDSSELVGKHFY